MNGAIGSVNWDAVSAISNAVGVIVIIISLLYLALQIRFARLAAADTSRTARATGVRDIDLTMVNNAELRENWLKSSDLNSTYEKLGTQLNLSVEEALQVDTVCQCWMRLHWGQFKSITTPEDLKDLESLISVFYLSPPMKNCWVESPYGKATYDVEFVKFVDDAVLKNSK